MAYRQLCRRPPPRWRQRLQGSSSSRRRRSRWPAWRRTPPPPSQRYTLLTASLQSAQKHGVGFPSCQGQPGGGHRRPLLRDVHPCLAASSHPFWKHVMGFAFCQGSCNVTQASRGQPRALVVSRTSTQGCLLLWCHSGHFVDCQHLLVVSGLGAYLRLTAGSSSCS